MSTHISIHPSVDMLTATTAARLITELVDAQNERGEATVVLTGGSVGIATLAAVAHAPAREAVDWSRVNFWWGDERFVPAEHPESNARQATEALLSHIDCIQERVHPMVGPDLFPDPHTAAAAYASHLREVAEQERYEQEGEHSGDTQGLVPCIDVVLLGIGPDAHVASLFPDMAGVRQERATVVGVDNAPKPPPQRMSLTLPAINSARQVWLVAAGNNKAGAVSLALAGANPVQVPAAGPRGRRSTRWLLDREAAAKAPEELMGHLPAT